MTKKIFAFLLLFFSLSYAGAQEPIPLTYNSFMLGMGSVNVYDSFLSPLEYKGTKGGFMFEQMRQTKLGNGNITAQHLLNLEFASAENPAKNATHYTGNLEYSYGLFYHLKPIDRFRFFAGVQADGLFGFIYNTRNGNNPATPKVNINLNLSGIATYGFQIKKQPILLRYQLNVPFVGAMYASEYGQSYYEMDMADYEGIVKFASFHNQLMLRNTFSVELPFNSAYILRLAYMNNFYETRVNDLDTRIFSNSFYIGVSYNLFTVSGRKSSSSPYRNVFQ